jgi:hypothetical protein
MVRKHMAEVRVLHYSLTLFVIGVHSKPCLIFGGKVGACVSIKLSDLMLLFTMTKIFSFDIPAPIPKKNEFVVV